MRTIEEFILKFKVEGQAAVKQASGAIKGLSEDLAQFGQAGGVFGNTISGVLGKLGPLGLAAGAAGGAFVALGLKAIDLADALDDLSGATGISASEILSLKKSIVDAGGGADDYQQMLSKLRQATEEAAGGNEKFRKAFQDIGVYVLDANGKMRPTSDILQNLLEKFQKGEISGKAYAAAVDILGKDLNKLDITKLQAINDPFQDEQIKQLAKYRTAIDSIGNSISNSLLKYFGELAIEMDKSFKKAEEIEKKLNEKGRGSYISPGTRGFISNMLGMEPRAPLITRDIASEKAAKDHLANMKEIEAENQKIRDSQNGRGKTPNAGSFGGTSEAEIKAAKDSAARIEASRAEVAKSGRLSAFDEIANIELNKESDIAKAKVDIYNKDNLTKKQMADEFADKQAEIEAKAQADISKIRLTGSRTLSDQLLGIEQDTADKIAQIQESRLSGPEKERLRITREITKEREKAIQTAGKTSGIDLMDFLKQKDAIDEFYNNLEEKQLAQIDYQNSFAGGWTTAFDAYILSATNAANQAQGIFNAMTNGMNSAIDKFVETGKFSFNDFASSVIKDILKIQLKAAAANLFAAGSSFLGFSLPGKALGGPVSAGQPYMIGEKGPEMFIPASAGNIIPNNMLGGRNGSSGSNTYITNNISAIDSKSVAQLFSENRQTLFGNVEQARRELPMRTR